MPSIEFQQRFAREAGGNHIDGRPLAQIYGAYPQVNNQPCVPIATDDVSHVPGVDGLVANGTVSPKLYRGRQRGLVPGIVVVGEPEYHGQLDQLRYLHGLSLARTPSRLVVPVDTGRNGADLSIEDAILEDLGTFQDRLHDALFGEELMADKLWIPYCGSEKSDQIAKQMRQDGMPWINPVSGSVARRMNAKHYAEHLIGRGFNFPKTELVSDPREVNAQFERINQGHGVMMKPDMGASGFQQFACRNGDDLEACKSFLESGEYVMQAFAEGILASPSVSLRVGPKPGEVHLLGGTTQIFKKDTQTGQPTSEHIGNYSNHVLFKVFPDLKGELIRLGQTLQAEGYHGNFGADIYAQTKNPGVLAAWKDSNGHNLEAFMLRNREHLQWSFGEINARFLGASRGPFRDLDLQAQLAVQGKAATERHWLIKKVAKPDDFQTFLEKLDQARIAWDPSTSTGVFVTTYDVNKDGGHLFHYDIHANDSDRLWEMEDAVSSL